MLDDEKQIRSACAAYAKCMESMDFETLKGLWDSEYEHLVYQPEEYQRACRSWDDIVNYFDYIPKVVDSIPEWREVASDVALVGEAAFVYSVFATRFNLKNDGQPLEGEVRFSFGLRRTSDGWRFFHCHESRRSIDENAAAV
jgi:ketosteroid isomerase-like protein